MTFSLLVSKKYDSLALSNLVKVGFRVKAGIIESILNIIWSSENPVKDLIHLSTELLSTNNRVN